MTKVGLRIDVDTFRGTREGVPRLLETLNRHNVRASFFFSVGPDNMGRHLWLSCEATISVEDAALKRSIALRMGYIARGNRVAGKRDWPGQCAIIAQTALIHETGLHAWDHHAWQARSGNWNDNS